MMSSDVAVGAPAVVSTPCMLTIEPFWMQLSTAPLVHWLCGSNTCVEELIASVSVPRTDDSTVILLDEIAVTSPVKSSKFAKAPLANPAGTVLVAVMTPDCVTSIASAPLLVTTALL